MRVRNSSFGDVLLSSLDRRCIAGVRQRGGRVYCGLCSLLYTMHVLCRQHAQCRAMKYCMGDAHLEIWHHNSTPYNQHQTGWTSSHPLIG